MLADVIGEMDGKIITLFGVTSTQTENKTFLSEFVWSIPLRPYLSCVQLHYSLLMRKRLNVKVLFACTLILLTSILPHQTSYAAIKPGTTCAKKGLTQIINNKKFTCLVKGKKFVWSEGHVVKTPTPVSVPSITPAPSPISTSVAKIYISPAHAEVNTYCSNTAEIAFTLQGAVSCINEIWTHQSADSSVRAAAFSSVLARWNTQQPPLLTLDLHKDPSSGDWVNEVAVGINASAQLWGSDSFPQIKLPIFISDSPKYIEDELASAGILQSPDAKLRNANAVGSQMGFNSDSLNHVVYLDFMIPKKEQQPGAQAASGVHEFSHYAQFALSKNAWHKQNNLPWMIEGLATYLATTLGPMTSGTHNQMLEWDSSLTQTSTKLSYWGKDIPEIFSSPSWHDIYVNGAEASEALVALVGINSVIQMWSDLGAGFSYTDSLKRNFGLSGDALNQLLDQYVQSKKSGTQWTLQELQSKYALAKTGG